MAIPSTFVAGSTTDVAPVAAIPTTAAHFAILNGEASGGKTYIITSVSLLTTTSAAAAQTLTLLANNLPAPVSAAGGFAGTAALGPKSLGGSASTRAGVYSAVTIVNSGLWHPVTPSVNEGAQTANIGQSVWAYVRGIYYVPPGGIFCLAGFCSAAGSAKCQLYVTWEEQQLT